MVWAGQLYHYKWTDTGIDFSLLWNFFYLEIIYSNRHTSIDFMQKALLVNRNVFARLQCSASYIKRTVHISVTLTDQLRLCSVTDHKHHCIDWLKEMFNLSENLQSTVGIVPQTKFQTHCPSSRFIRFDARLCLWYDTQWVYRSCLHVNWMRKALLRVEANNLLYPGVELPLTRSEHMVW